MAGDTMISILGILLIIGVAAYLFVPYFLGIENVQKEKTVNDDPKNALLSGLADLMYDYKSGKISEEDFKKLRMEIEAQLYALEHPESAEWKDLNDADSSDKESDEKN